VHQTPDAEGVMENNAQMMTLQGERQLEPDPESVFGLETHMSHESS